MEYNKLDFLFFFPPFISNLTPPSRVERHVHAGAHKRLWGRCSRQWRWRVQRRRVRGRRGGARRRDGAPWSLFAALRSASGCTPPRTRERAGGPARWSHTSQGTNSLGEGSRRNRRRLRKRARGTNGTPRPGRSSPPGSSCRCGEPQGLCLNSKPRLRAPLGRACGLTWASRAAHICRSSSRSM